MTVSFFPILLWLMTSLICVLLNAKRPNILFIVSDDLGYDDLGFKSHQILTPNIDKFRSEGQFLEWYYGQSTCSPTRAAFLTGKYPLHNGINGWIHTDARFGVPLNDIMLSKTLKMYGNYDTHSVGKWHLGFYKWDYTPTFRGFNSFYGYYTGGEDYFTHKSSKYYDFRYDKELNCGTNCSQVLTSAYKHYSAQLFTTRAQTIIKQYSNTKELNNQSLFLYLAYQSVHSPADVIPRYEEMYGGSSQENPNYINDTTRRKFAGMVTIMDEGIGNITKTLKEYNLFDDNLIIIFTSDNGGPIPGDDGGDFIGARNWPLKGGKHSIWEGGTRITGIIWSTPDIISRNLSTINGNYTQLMHATDWYPTLLDAANIDKNNISFNISTLDGISQWDGILGKYNINLNISARINNNIGARMLNSGPKTDIREDIYYGVNCYSDPENETAYQWHGYKIFNNTGGAPDYWYPPVKSIEKSNDIYWKNYSKLYMPQYLKITSMYPLFNLSNDPTEHNDISNENNDLVTMLLQKMDQQRVTGIPQATNDPNCTSNIPHPQYPTVGGVWEPWC